MNEVDAQRREVAWRGLDDEQRLDIVSVEFSGDGGFVATGAQSTESYRARWDLIVDSSWRTRMLTVDVEGIGPADSTEIVPPWQRRLNLWRRDGANGDSQWRCEGGESGDVPRQFGEIGLADESLSLLADTVDVDLAGCPLTNTMPIRRFGFDQVDAAPTERPLTTAWVSLPDLAVRPASQSYSPAAEGLSDIATALDPRVAGVVHYRSATRDVSVDLSFDADGIVVAYPALAARMELQ